MRCSKKNGSLTNFVENRIIAEFHFLWQVMNPFCYNNNLSTNDLKYLRFQNRPQNMSKNQKNQYSILNIQSYYLQIIVCCMVLFTTCKRDFSPIQDSSPVQPQENPYQLIPGGYPDWSPTGEKLAFIRNNDLHVYYFADSLTNKAAFEEWVAENATEPSFAPDGEKIVFERDRRIYTIDLETRQERFLAEGITPSWSENGKWIAFGHKEAQKVLTDGTQILGQPSPDSSLYYYDLQSGSIVRVLVTNYDSLHIGTLLSMSHPEWAMGDSILLFDTELGIWKVKREGGKAIFFTDEFNLRKTNSITELAFQGQPAWLNKDSLLAYFLILDQRPVGDVIKCISIRSRISALGLKSGFSDPTWSPGGHELVLVKDGSLYVYDITEYLDDL